MASVGAVLLAAGSSSRFGEANKLLANWCGRALISHVASILAAAGLDDIVVVTGAGETAIRSALAGLPLRFVANPDHAAGMGRSIAVGIGAMTPDSPGAFVVPGDMPRLDAAVLQDMMRVFAAHGGHCIVYPATANGEQRNPVLWPRARFPELMALTGPQGARPVLERYRAEAVPITAQDDAMFADIDTPADLARLLGP